jgi:hypothetical protein
MGAAGSVNEDKAQVVENETGGNNFLNIHEPSTGVGIASLALLVVFGGLIYWLVKRCGWCDGGGGRSVRDGRGRGGCGVCDDWCGSRRPPGDRSHSHGPGFGMRGMRADSAAEEYALGYYFPPPPPPYPGFYGQPWGPYGRGSPPAAYGFDGLPAFYTDRISSVPEEPAVRQVRGGRPAPAAAAAPAPAPRGALRPHPHVRPPAPPATAGIDLDANV